MSIDWPAWKAIVDHRLAKLEKIEVLLSIHRKLERIERRLNENDKLAELANQLDAATDGLSAAIESQTGPEPSAP